MNGAEIDVTKPFVLQEDVVLIPCAELDAKLRSKISWDDGDFTLAHRRRRVRSKVIDGGTAALLALFREPRTIVSAVVENSRTMGADPRARLDELLRPLARFVEDRVLVQAGSAEQTALRPRFDGGAFVAGWEIIRCVSFVEDTDIYQVRRDGRTAALKIARGTTAEIKSVLKNEIAVLRHLDGGGIAPRLIANGLHKGAAYLVIDWIDGVEAGVAAAQRSSDRASLIALCASIAGAYAALHARGILHGDVHPRNVLAGDGVTLIDFGFSRFTGRRRTVRRAGIQLFYEPEYFAAWRNGTGMPSSAAGEQYSLAALLYLLIAGRHYLEFRFDRDEMARQVLDDSPLPFAACGIAPWPEVECVLFRALEKDPSQRYGSMGEFAAALAAVRDAAAREALSASASAEANAFVETTLRSLARGGDVFEAGYPPPTASINDGCAGAAVGLLRVAEARGDPALLALADIWASRAVALAGTAGAWRTENGLASEVTPYHNEPGAHAAVALIAASRGDIATQRGAIAAFIAASEKHAKQLDVTLGRSGSLLAAAVLLESVSGNAKTLRTFGANTMRAIWQELDAAPPLTHARPGTYLGIAHGWAGFIYAALRWCATSGDPLPPRLLDRLEQLAALKQRKGRGAFWPNRVGQSEPNLIAGWCNGSAGLLFLFTLAHHVFSARQWLELAELCAWNTWDEPRFNATLCCGTAGRAYALLNLYRHTGAAEWLGRARQLANHAASTASQTGSRSLLKGGLGVAVLVADLASPENARMPFFE
jgi:eukaryotic-like serine/threonine-protein kinase